MVPVIQESGDGAARCQHNLIERRSYSVLALLPLDRFPPRLIKTIFKTIEKRGSSLDIWHFVREDLEAFRFHRGPCLRGLEQGRIVIDASGPTVARRSTGENCASAYLPAATWDHSTWSR